MNATDTEKSQWAHGQTFVLVPGAWMGGWVWQPVAELLREHGHRVLTPTLAGLEPAAQPSQACLTRGANYATCYW